LGADTVCLHPPSCRDTRALLASGNEADAQAFIADNPHKRLWQLLAEHALEKLDLAVAEKAFVHCGDYQGVQLVKRLAQLGDKAKQQAEVKLDCGLLRVWSARHWSCGCAECAWC
jgi:WD repeat-containing protein 35